MDPRDEMPRDLRRILDSAPLDKSGIDYSLWSQRFAVTNTTFYALFPQPMTFCSHHARIRPAERMPLEVMMHHRSHIPGSSELRVVAICEYCAEKVPIEGIAAHMRFKHDTNAFTKTMSDIASLHLKPDSYRPLSSVKDSADV